MAFTEVVKILKFSDLLEEKLTNIIEIIKCLNGKSDQNKSNEVIAMKD
jgi:hypothetical protein